MSAKGLRGGGRSGEQSDHESKSKVQPHSGQGESARSGPHTKVQKFCPNHKREITRNLIVYIGYGIYLGHVDACCAAFLKANKIKKVLSIGERSADYDTLHELNPNKPKSETVSEMLDMENTHMPEAELEERLEKLTKIIHDGTQEEGRIFVHCELGMSRSPLAVIAYLQAYQGFTWEEAFVFVARRHVRTTLHPCFKLYARKKAAKEGSDESFDYRSVTAQKYFRDRDVSFANIKQDNRRHRGIRYSTEVGKEPDHPASSDDE